MNVQDIEQIILLILTRAQEGKFTEFHLITNWAEYKWYRDEVADTKMLTKVLQRSADNLFKDYCKTVTSGISDVTQLLAYTQLTDAVTFYKTELDTLNSMIAEYVNYLRQGNLLYAFLGGNRFDNNH